jgi:hypothetical protein
MDRPRDILQNLLAGVLDVERYLIARVIKDRLRDTYATGFCDALKPRRDVNVIPKNIMRLGDYVADIHAHAESNAIVFRIADCKFLDAGLELYSSSNRFDRAGKLGQEPVSGVLDYTAAVFGDCWVDGLSQERSQSGMRCLFVVVHEPRIASHIGGQYRRQPALDPDWPLLRHGSQSCVQHTL